MATIDPIESMPTALAPSRWRYRRLVGARVICEGEIDD